MERKAAAVKRQLQRTTGGLCRCGGPRVYVAFLSFDSRNINGKRIRVQQIRSFCEIHGRAYAVRWKLELPE